MNRENLYHKTVDILVQAYFNDTLEHDNCFACAVGNIVASGCNIELEKTHGFSAVTWNSLQLPYWKTVFLTGDCTQRVNPQNYKGIAKKQIDATGYSWEQLAIIEYAFESAIKGNSSEEYMFNGLMSVIEALDEIHENKDPEVSTKSKNRFCKV